MRKRIKAFTNYQLRFNPLFRLKLKQILDQKDWSAERLKEKQNQSFLRLLTKSVSRSKFYKKYYADHGVDLSQIKSVEDIHLLPIITKDHVRKNTSDIVVGNTFTKAKGRTSGSAGTPLMVYRDYNSTLIEGAYSWAQRSLFGYQPGMKVISLRGNLYRHEMKWYDPYFNCLYLSSFNLKEENADFYYQQIKQFSPYAILAYPSSVEILANFFSAKGHTLNVPYIFTSSEQVYPHQRAKVEQTFNTTIVDWYGNAERTIAIEQRENKEYYELPLYSVNEYKENCVITTGLISSSFPLIRYQVDDRIIPDTKSSKFRIKEILGRHDDLLVLPDGTKVGRFGAAFLDIHGLEYAQIHQKVQESFLINLVVNDMFDKASLTQIQAGMAKIAGNNISYEIKYVKEEDIVRTSAGKYKLVINELDV
ncbi:MAG: hypothetical protein ACFB15_15900 [Cyclobacteriaceae bacterium]